VKRENYVVFYRIRKRIRKKNVKRGERNLVHIENFSETLKTDIFWYEFGMK
jgi:hypothetical protein